MQERGAQSIATALVILGLGFLEGRAAGQGNQGRETRVREKTNLFQALSEFGLPPGRPTSGEPSLIAYGARDVDGRRQILMANADGSNQKQLASTAAAVEDRTATSSRDGSSRAAGAPARSLSCPAAGAVVDLAMGDWALQSDCSVAGISLHGDAQLWAEGLSLSVNGDVFLEGKASLHIMGGSFSLANHTVSEHRINAKGDALLDIRDANVSTNAGVAGNLSSDYRGFDDSRLHIENVQFDYTKSWLLATLHGRARLETKNSTHFSSEIYPTEKTTVRIEGERSDHGVWLYFLPGSSAVIDHLPSAPPFTFSFGRMTPGVKGVGYQVDVIQGRAGFGIFSFPGSRVTVRDNPTPVGLNYMLADVTSSETLTALCGGRQTRTYENQGRTLALENADLGPMGWQLYNVNGSIPPSSVAPVTVSDSLINELGALARGRFEVVHVQFAFTLIAAVGPGSLVHVRDSVINSQTIQAASDGAIRIEDSEIHGSMVQATDSSRILLLNDALRKNECHAKCMPRCMSLDGSPPTQCTPFNPSLDVQFVARGQAAILVAGIDPIASAIPAGNTYAFVGDVIAKTPGDRPYTYSLRYRKTSSATFTAIIADVAGPRRAQPLGELDTTGLAPGDYMIELGLIVPGLQPVAVRQPFTISE